MKIMINLLFHIHLKILTNISCYNNINYQHIFIIFRGASKQVEKMVNCFNNINNNILKK